MTFFINYDIVILLNSTIFDYILCFLLFFGIIMKQGFGEFIREKRLKKGYKLKTFANLVGISSVYESYIERGNRPSPSQLILEKMAKVLSLSPSEAHHMYNLAALTHTKLNLPNDIIEYISDRDYVIETIRSANKFELSKDEWETIKKHIDSGRYSS